MSEQIELEEIIKLLNDGFSPDLIAFEFDLSQEYVAKCQQLLEQRKAKPKVSSSKMDNMRNKYKTLCSQGKGTKSTQAKCQSSSQTSAIEHAISIMEEKLGSMHNMQSKDKQKLAISLLEDLKQLPSITLTLEQAERLHNVWSANVLHNLNFDNIDFSYRISNVQRKFSRIFARNYFF